MALIRVPPAPHKLTAYKKGHHMKTSRHTGTFDAIGTDGETYTLYEFTDFIDVVNFGAPRSSIPGLKELKTSDGLHVNRIEKGQYKIVQSGILLRSESPDAP